MKRASEGTPARAGLPIWAAVMIGVIGVALGIVGTFAYSLLHVMMGGHY